MNQQACPHGTAPHTFCPVCTGLQLEEEKNVRDAKLPYKTGDTGTYSEMGNKGRVRVAGCAWDTHDAERYNVSVIALEDLDGSTIVKPIPKGTAFTVGANINAGAHRGWHIEKDMT
jgi:hypothetical protein